MLKSFLKKIIVAIITLEAKLIIKKYKPKIVGITGSVGKTSTKDAIYTALSKKKHSRKSAKSFNSEIGVPLTILGCDNAWNNPILWVKNIFVGFLTIFFKKNYPKLLILEIGLDTPGDIEKITKWLPLDVAIITKLASVPVHIEFFKSRDELHKEKKLIVKALKKDGTLIINADDKFSEDVYSEETRNKISFGLSENADVFSEGYEILYNKDSKPFGFKFSVSYKDEKRLLSQNGTIGTHHIYPLLASIAVSVVFKQNLNFTFEELENHKTAPGRMRILEGIKKSTIIDDSYNASPTATRLAIETIKKLHTRGKKIFIFGDMLELGKNMKNEHEKIGSLVCDAIDIFITVGSRALISAEKAKECCKTHICKDSSEAGKLARNLIEKDDMVLVKGSQSIRMERAVKTLLKDQASAKDLLVRQEREWLSRP